MFSGDCIAARRPPPLLTARNIAAKNPNTFSEGAMYDGNAGKVKTLCSDASSISQYLQYQLSISLASTFLILQIRRVSPKLIYFESVDVVMCVIDELQSFYDRRIVPHWHRDPG